VRYRVLSVAVVASLGLRAPVEATETKLKSPAFGHGQPIPKRHTCEGEGVSVPLTWPDPPKGTQTFVILAADPTVSEGTRIHWVVYDLPPTTRELAAGVPARQKLRGGGKQGRNDLGTLGYAAPCPDPGQRHEYWFRIYALDRPLELPGGASPTKIQKAMLPHVLWVAEVMGTFTREAPQPSPR
jgi:Raf kinase inhibitor-like YbhB/YbcL family protein